MGEFLADNDTFSKKVDLGLNRNQSVEIEVKSKVSFAASDMTNLSLILPILLF